MLTNNTSKAVFLGNGTATQFPFTFKVWDASQLIVEVTDPQSITTTASNWSVAFSANGGTVTYLYEGNPLPRGYKLSILRNMPFKQEVDLITGTRFDPQVIENALDKATAERQQLLEAVERCIKTSPTDTITPQELITELRNNTALAVNSANSAQASADAAQEWIEQADISVGTALAQVAAEGDKQVKLISSQASTTPKANAIVKLQSNGTATEAMKDAFTLEEVSHAIENGQIGNAISNDVPYLNSQSNFRGVLTSSTESLPTGVTGGMVFSFRGGSTTALYQIIVSSDGIRYRIKSTGQEWTNTIWRFIPSQAPYITDSWANSNKTQWYRKWSDGFIEQGIYAPFSNGVFNLPHRMYTYNYTVNVLQKSEDEQALVQVDYGIKAFYYTAVHLKGVKQSSGAVANPAQSVAIYIAGY